MPASALQPVRGLLLTKKNDGIMITLQELKRINAGFSAPYYALSEENWETNLRIATNVESNFFTVYEKDKKTPQKGDVIEISNGYEVFEHALVEDVNKYGMMYICENGSTFTDGKHFSTSGGSFTHIHSSHFELAGYETRMFWTWGCFGSGAHQGIYFPITVKKFRQKDMKVKPYHQIYFCNPYYKDRRMKVQIMKDWNYILHEFKTIKAFKAFAEHIGLTYRKENSGRYFSNQFLKDKLFWTMDELPKDCKPFYGLSNGNMVTCYAHKEGDVITFYRPNPNAKDVYKPLDMDGRRKYDGNPLGI